MWIKNDGSIYDGDRCAEDRKEPATQAEIDAWRAAQIAARPDLSNLDNIEKSMRALALVVAQWNGKTIPQLKAAFKTARDSLP